VDVLVDGPFMLDKRDISLKYRGSSNQRVLSREEIRKLRFSEVSG
jgi:anaerobic ribonucleoside-triphosphate reductase activating protein